MMKKKKGTMKRAAAAIEFMALVVFLLGALLVFQKYILQAFWGQWKKTGDAFGQGRQYDPREFGPNGDGGGTLQCMYAYDDPSDPSSAGEWVLQPCFDKCMEDPSNAQAVLQSCFSDCAASSGGMKVVLELCYNDCLKEPIDSKLKQQCRINCGGSNASLCY